MNRLSMMMVALVIALGSGFAAHAAAMSDPAIGTWILNVEKSKFIPGPAPKSQIRTYTQTADGVTLTIAGVAADGSTMSGTSTFKYDGKDYPISGSPDYDMLTLKRVNGSTVSSVQKLNGKIVARTTRTISGHGKVLTLTSKGTNSKGAAYHNVYVFDKQ